MAKTTYGQGDKPNAPFSAALADALITRYKMSSGQIASSNDWITNPARAVGDAMTDPDTEDSYSEEDTSGYIDTPARGGDPPIAPQTEELPTAPKGVSDQYIMDKFAGMEQALSGLTAPAPQEAPGEVDPWKQFAATLAGSFASQISKRPDLLEVATRNIEMLRKRRQQIMDQNYVNKMLFDKEQQNRVVSVRVQALSTLMDKAIADGNADKAAYYAEKIHVMQANAQKEISRFEQESMNYRQDQALAASETEKKLELTAKVAEKKAEAGKPLEMKDYNAQSIQIDSADPEKLLDKVIVPFGFDDKKSITKEDMHLFNDAAGSIGGTDEVRLVAFPRFVTRLKKRLGFANKDYAKFSDSEIKRFYSSMVKYGIPSDMAQNFLAMQPGVKLIKPPQQEAK